MLKDKLAIKTIVELHRWTDEKVVDWVNTNFDDAAKDIVYVTLLWVADNWPEMRKKLGIKTYTTEDMGG